jgi:simple sugar transport system permease protein
MIPRLSLFRGARLERQATVSTSVSVLTRLIAVGIAFLVAGIAVEIAGKSSLFLLLKAFRTTFGSVRGLQDILLLSTPITLTGFAVIIGMKMGVWNIGIEGQFLVGALAASAAGLYIPAPPALSILIMFLAGAAGGAVWISLPALASAYRGVNELITTLLMNFVALLLVSHFASGPMRDLELGGHLAAPRIPHVLPTLFGTRLHIGIFFPIVVAVALNYALKHTRWGYELTVMGKNRQAARYAGMPIVRYVFVTLLLSGAIAGAAGMIELAGTTFRLSATISPGYGYIGFLIAALANFEPIAMLISGCLYAAILNGGIALKTEGFSVNFVVAITGLILLFSTIGENLAHYRVIRRQPSEGVGLSRANSSLDPGGAPRP